MKINPISCTKYQYNKTTNSRKNSIKNPSTINFTSNQGTMLSKMQVFLPEISEFIARENKITLDATKNIVKRASEKVDVAEFSQVPRNLNLSPAAGAYFHCPYVFDRHTFSTVIEQPRKLYLNIPKTDSIYDRLKFLGDIVHEMTHVFYEEVADRPSKINFLRKFLTKDNLPSTRQQTLMALPKAFTHSEYIMQEPLRATLNKTNEMPLPVNVLSDEALNQIYQQTVNCPVDRYIIAAINDALVRTKEALPESDLKTMLDYIALTGRNEMEAYSNATNVLKTALSLKGPADLDYRVLLYDHFAKIAENAQI